MESMSGILTSSHVRDVFSDITTWFPSGGNWLALAWNQQRNRYVRCVYL